MPSLPSIYLDANATTRMDPLIRELVSDALDREWGNPSSIHHIGRQARASLDDARDRVARVLRCRPSEVIFTSGGTEANNLAILGTARRHRGRGRHLVCSAIEHPAVLHGIRHLVEFEGFTHSIAPVDASGRLSAESLRSVVRPDTILVSVMAANNEIGTLQPVAEIGAWCRERGVLFHCDAVQWFGKEPWPGVDLFPADLVTLCSHKFHGPKGCGVLYVRSPLQLEPRALGGSQEFDRRAGTENLPAILGLAAAVERFVTPPVFPSTRLNPISARLESLLDSIDGVRRVSPATGRLSNTVSFTVAGSDSIALLANLDLAGICASSGSACSAGSVEPSHVLRAIGCSPAEAAALVRFSLDRDTTIDDLARVEACLPDVIRRSRSF